MEFKIKVEPEAHQDIQQGINWYNRQQVGLGRKFHAEVKTTFRRLRINPFFQIRYDEVHCLPLKKFPFMIHFTIDDGNMLVIVRAVFHTAKNPENWKSRD